jgi:hypothetical protein
MTSNTQSEETTARRNAEDIVAHVKERGVFKARKPEGKIIDH